ncbi:MAG TPA: CmpA/NrtA family ABC transporter substrate-binding protein [Pseudolabrys sp.]|nr:CmpA/NrtA family ABC transporter substrate-binding protein [Pseudolabrys sp.]
MSERLRIGYIPLVDATTLLVAVDQGFAAAQGLDIELVREVSWSNVRDKLNIGLFDAAHLLSPVAIASSLGLGHVRVPLIVPFNLGINGNAITVSTDLFAVLSDVSDGDITDPKVSSRALARVVAERKKRGAEPLTFGMTFPFSNHNYQLRFWMAAAGLDPDEDVRLVVLPPPYMVESLASGHVDGFCVGAPWNSVAVDSGIGRILHFGCEITEHVSEKVFALREKWAGENPNILAALMRALARASEFAKDANNLSTVANIVAPRLGVVSELVVRTLTGSLKIDADGAVRHSENYIAIGGRDVNRPDAVQAAWAYAQIVRWGQAPLSQDLCARAQNVFRPGIYDAVLGSTIEPRLTGPRDGIGAFSGPDFDAHDIAGHVSAWQTKRAYRPRLSVVR